MVKPAADEETKIVSSSVSASEAVTNVNSALAGVLVVVNGAAALAVMVRVAETGVKSPLSAEPPSAVPSACRFMDTVVFSVMGSAPAGREATAVIVVVEPSPTRDGDTDTTSGGKTGVGDGDALGSVMDTVAETPW